MIALIYHSFQQLPDTFILVVIVSLCGHMTNIMFNVHFWLFVVTSGGKGAVAIAHLTPLFFRSFEQLW